MWGVTLQKPGPVLPCEVTVRGGSPRPGPHPWCPHRSHTWDTPASVYPLRPQYFPQPIATLPPPDQTSALGLLSATSRMFSLCFERRGLHVWAARCGPAGGDVMPPTSLQPDTSSKSRNLVTVTTQNSFSFSQFFLKMNVFLCFSLFYCNTCKHETKT